MTRRVYEAVIGRSRATLLGGFAAIADAVFARTADREAIERAAAAAGVPFIGLWLEAPEAVLLARAGTRRADASDADARVIRRQLQDGSGPLSWVRIDASGPLDRVVDAATRAIRERASTTAARGAHG
jgi:predicted kinase